MNDDIVERLGRRIHNQRVRLRYWEELFNEHVHAHLHALHPRHLMKAIELGNENFRLRQLLSEAEKRALASQGIKPLEWTGKKASTRFATYWLSPDGKRLTMFFDGDASTTSHEDEAAARKAAQEHHEACLSDYV